MKKIKKVLYAEGNFHYWKEGDLHTDKGVIKENILKDAKGKIKSNKDIEFNIFDPTFTDYLATMKRGPQIMTPKDVGLVLARTNIDKDSVVLEAGTGSGALTFHLARFVKKVISYEKREEFYKIAKENMEFFGAKNVTLKFGDVEEHLEETNIDLIVFDLAEPWKLVEKSYNALKPGQYLVVYLPSITQVMHFVKKANEKFFVEHIVELLEREWHVEEKRVRPQSQMIAHTAFLVFARKI